MTADQRNNKDQWSSEKYATSAAFVPLLTTKVLSYLNPSPTDRILDIGCGDGPLTAKIAATVLQGEVVGVDSSPSMIHTAQTQHSSTPNISFHIADATALSISASGPLAPSTFDKIFSNAALHWILRSPTTRHSVFRAFHALLKPNGRLVFEMGGAGCVAEVHAALTGALVAFGYASSFAEARESSPWYFADVGAMRQLLEGAGFEVEVCEKEYRPTELTRNEGGGLAGWVRLMGDSFLRTVPEGEKREEVVQWVVEVCRGACEREDGSWWLGYVRLRVVARKPPA
ncbi:Methyltransferase type 11 [Macrophomina phaseolina MS6]|uniref:Methyltransferase type 11 n=1 Tax=Macrophomina phaseolina (strain MS6) TaxID=1126212 RepID=K2S5Q3_MACPH|nr:Methyltransferase type 11 [Macrophomina phaseolina MS6]